MSDIATKLDQLAEFRAQRDLVTANKRAAIDSVLTPEIRAKLAEIETEFEYQAQAADANITALEAQIKAEVLGQGESVKGARLMAVWSKGRVSWDDTGLQAYMRDHPEIARFRTQGEPSISIRQRAAE